MKKQLTLWDATMIVMGSMIGSGIFIVSSDMMRQLGSGYWMLSVWIITAIATVAAAICYGELSSMYPKAGGQYAYMTEIFGKMTGFCTAGVCLRSYRRALLRPLRSPLANLRLISSLRSMMLHLYTRTGHL